MLQIKNVSVFYKSKKEEIKAVGPINVTLHKDEICAIIGPSGCGKSTLLNVLSGIIKNYEGEVLLNNEELDPHIHKIGFISQNFGLLPWKTVEENCLLPFKIKKIRKDNKVYETMLSIMDKLNIKNLRDKYPNQLSGGQKQRVAIVRSFLMQPDLLLMDEAFSALDEIIREEAQELFLDIWNESKSNTLFVTHSIDEALYMGKKIIIMSNTPGIMLDIIDNPLFSNKNFKNDENYGQLFSYIKSLIKRGWTSARN